METHTAESHEQIIEHLNKLIAVDYDAVAAYEAAIERLEHEPYKQKLSQFLADHRRHIQELTESVTMLGGSPRTKGDVKQVLTKGKVVIANLGGDKQILEAMKSNEDETNEQYDRAVQELSPVAPERIRGVLTRGLEDERRHREWIVQTLRGM